MMGALVEAATEEEEAEEVEEEEEVVVEVKEEEVEEEEEVGGCGLVQWVELLRATTEIYSTALHLLIKLTSWCSMR